MPTTPATIPKIIHQTWKDTISIPAQCVPYIQSWKDLHPSWEFKFYTDADNLAFVTANYPELLAQYNAYKYPIQRVDLVRCLYLRKFGGVYVDIDMICYKAIDPLMKNTSLVLTDIRGDLKKPYITNAFMASTIDHPYWTAVIKDMTEAANTNTGNMVKDVHNSTGAVILTAEVSKFKDAKILPRISFHPIQWNERVSADPTKLKTPHSYGAHMYLSSWIK